MQAHLSVATGLDRRSEERAHEPSAADASRDAAASSTGQTPASSKRAFLLTHGLAWCACLVALNLVPAPIASLVVLAYLGLAPGDALRTALRVRAPEVHLRALLAVATSLGVLMGAGAASRFVAPAFGIDVQRSLTAAPLFGLVSVVVGVCLFAVAADRRHDAGAVPDAVQWLTWGLLSVPLLLTCVGAKVVDQTGVPAVTAAALALLGVAVVVCAVADSPWARRLRPSVLFAFVLAVAWSFSQRTEYLFGYDVHQEHAWALRTLEAGHWVHTLGDAYGAMLSITTLPAALVSLSGIALVDYFKTLAPIAFAFYVMGMHLFGRRFVSDRAAFVATLLVALVPQALWQLPAVSRQELGLLTFVAIALLLFTDKGRGTGNHVLASILAVVLAVTHYTTSYVALGLFVGAALVSFVARRAVPSARTSPRYLSPVVLVALVVATIGWNTFFTQSSGNVGAATDKAASQAGLQQRQGGILQSFLDGINATEGTPSAYFAETQVDAESRHWKLVYSPQIQREFIAQTPERPVPEQRGPLSALAPVSEPAYVLLRQGINLLAVVGVAMLVLVTVRPGTRWRGPRRGRHDAGARSPTAWAPGPVPLDLVGLALAALMLTAVTRFNASLAQAYNPERLLLQTGLFLAVAIAFALEVAARRLESAGRRRSRRLTAVPALVALGLASLMVVDATGLRAALTVRDAGNLVRDGEYAHRYRVTDADHDAASWLGSRYRYDDMVFADSYGVLLTHEDPRFRRGMMAELSPYTLDQRGYVLATTENVVDGMARVSASRIKTSFTYPREFMSTFKSRIYSNGTAEVYR